MFGPRHRIVLTAAAAATVLVVGCSSSSKSSSSSSSSSSSTPGATSAPSASSSAQVNALVASVKAGETATYKAVYLATGSGTTQTVTIEQKPPKTRFVAGSGEIVATGTTTYYCSTSGTKQCFSASTSNPLAAALQVFSPQTAVTAMQQVEGQVAARAAGYNVSFSSQTFAGQASTCMTASDAGKTVKYCVTKGGVLAYAGASGSSFSLTSFTTTVPDSDFAVSASTTITLPQ